MSAVPNYQDVENFKMVQAQWNTFQARTTIDSFVEQRVNVRKMGETALLLTESQMVLSDRSWQNVIFGVRKAFQGLQHVYPELLQEAVYRNIVTFTAAIHHHREKVRAEALAQQASTVAPVDTEATTTGVGPGGEYDGDIEMSVTVTSARDVLNVVSTLLKNMVIDTGAVATSRPVSEGPVTRSRKGKDNAKANKAKKTKAEKAAVKDGKRAEPRTEVKDEGSGKQRPKKRTRQETPEEDDLDASDDDARVVIDFRPSKEHHQVLARARQVVDQGHPMSHTKQALARMLIGHRAELEELSHTISFLLKRRDATMEEVNRLNNLMNDPAPDGGSSEANITATPDVVELDKGDKDEVEIIAAPPIDVDDGFVSA
ncbi:hypothetical protein BDZ94DRAFT_1234893 [Collybia nuda]|uniref:Uncharacterized protein n=1 Tax=Collybia nuda TaxID=64659 RepID=A0A9P6CG75_9AGAR|nr:hypothetical protein BDZ94DRAFT_1234893 [Collybia nuda]